jgi:addiction module RelE/StbE family toxin
MKVRWSKQAKRDRLNIFRYIKEESPDAAKRMNEIFDASTDKLKKFPNLGKPGRLPGTRELVVHKRYLLVYEVQQQGINIYALLHTSRQWPKR